MRNLLGDQPGSYIRILSVVLVGVDEPRPDDLVAGLLHITNVNTNPKIITELVELVPACIFDQFVGELVVRIFIGIFGFEIVVEVDVLDGAICHPELRGALGILIHRSAFATESIERWENRITKVAGMSKMCLEMSMGGASFSISVFSISCVSDPP